MANKKKDKREKFSAKVVYINGMGSELCRQCHDNCKRRMGRKGLRKEPSAE